MYGANQPSARIWSYTNCLAFLRLVQLGVLQSHTTRTTKASFRLKLHYSAFIFYRKQWTETRWHRFSCSSQELFCFSFLLKTGSTLDCLSVKIRISVAHQETLTVHWEIQVPQGRCLGAQPFLKLILEAIGSSSTTGIYPLLANMRLTHDPNGASSNVDKESKISTENSYAHPLCQ